MSPLPYSIAGFVALVAGFIFMGAPWWYYVVALILFAAIVVYILRQGFNRIKVTPVVGIPCPPLTHPVLGHPDYLVQQYGSNIAYYINLKASNFLLACTAVEPTKARLLLKSKQLC